MKWLLFLGLSGCSVSVNKTLHLFNGQTTKCLIAISDEGQVCWHGSYCTPDVGKDPSECPEGGTR